MKRKIIEIDREKCNGCGQCVNACHEGAIRMVNGKAELAGESYCDGLGACIGECPAGAIKLVEKEAPAFDEKAVEKHKSARHAEKPCGCPSMKVVSFDRASSECCGHAGSAQSELSQWPIQLKLVPVNAPFWENASVLIAADCSAFAFGGFHSTLLKGKKLIIACPKLDDPELYLEKLSDIFSANDIKSVTVAYMEVPCCAGLLKITEEAVAKSGKNIPVSKVKLSLDGKYLSSK